MISGFDIYLDEPLPGSSKYTLTTTFQKSDDNKTGALLLNIGTNYKTSNSFKVVGEVLIKVQKLQIRLKYLEYIFYSSCTNFSA